MTKKIIRKKKSKPTSYQAAKSLVAVDEVVTAQNLVDRLIDQGRREIPTKRSLSAQMKMDRDFLAVPVATSRSPAAYKRIAWEITMIDRIPCVFCQKLVWSDEATQTQFGDSCTRCAYPEIVAQYEVSPWTF